MATKTRLTLEEFLARPETKPASEFACGEVVQKPMPTGIHALLQMYLGVLLAQFLAHTKLGRVGTEWRCVFGPAGHERALVPDLVYIARERLTGGIAQLEGPFPGPPDLAVEILSPGQTMVGRLLDKIVFYLLSGVRLVWVIDPVARTVTVLAPDQQPRTLVSGDTLDGGAVLPGFRVAVDDIFAQLQV